MALQPATRRLLTEAAAAANYQPKGNYQPAGSYAPAGSYVTSAALAALEGAPSGIATLGSDGKVPAGQLPAATAPPQVYLNAAALVASAYTAVPGLQLDNLTPGLWRVKLSGVLISAGQSVNLQLKAVNGMVIANSAIPATASTSGQVVSRYMSTGGTSAVQTAGYAVSSNAVAPLIGSTNSPSGAEFDILGTLRITTGGSLQVLAGGGAAGVYLDAGAMLEATRLGA